MKALCIGLLVTMATVFAAAAPPDTSTKALVKMAAKYVADYQQQLAYVVGDEEYVQRTFNELGVPTRERIMNGELVLTYVEAEREWLAVHDVAAVDGEMVDRAGVRELLQRGAFEPVMRPLLSRNARFNIGSVERNFNEPTIALLVLEAKRLSGFSFERKNLAPSGGDLIATVAFDERETATIIHDATHRPVPIKGEFDMNVATGEIRRTRIEFKHGNHGVIGELATIYAKDKNVDLWVPATFTEHYVKKTSSDYERIECEARYKNWQRWGATMRIKTIKSKSD